LNKGKERWQSYEINFAKAGKNRDIREHKEHESNHFASSLTEKMQTKGTKSHMYYNKKLNNKKVDVSNESHYATIPTMIPKSLPN
jgi:hypothetical protein